MNICFMNDFQTNLRADIYVACLPFERPIIHPGQVLPKNQYLILEVSPHLPTTYQRIQLTRPIYNHDSRADQANLVYGAALLDKCEITWTHCHFSALAPELERAFNKQPNSCETLHVISFSIDEFTTGMWIFKRQFPVAYIPMGTPSAIRINIEQEKKWKLKIENALLITLQNYFEVLTNKKIVFELDLATAENLKLLAMVRYLMGDTLIYGFSESQENLRHLKFFKFLTHDTPVSERLSISEIYTQTALFLQFIDVPATVSKKFATYLSKHS